MTRTCPRCGRANRIPTRHLGDTGRCGQCKTTLPPQSVPLDVNGAELDDIVRESRLPVLVDFWAGWCGPCRMAAPEVNAVAAAHAGRALVLKVDTERHPDAAARFRIQGIPHFIVFRGGRPVFQASGVRRAAEMETWLQPS